MTEQGFPAGCGRCKAMREALLDLVRGAAITFSDERVGYEEIQVDRGALHRARAALDQSEAVK